MTLYRVIALPSDKLLAQNLTYWQAEIVKTDYLKVNPDKTVLIDKMPSIKLTSAIEILQEQWLVDCQVLTETTVYNLMDHAGYTFLKSAEIWVKAGNGEINELFALRHSLAIDGQRMLDEHAKDHILPRERSFGSDLMFQYGKDSAKWLDERGFNSALIYRAYTQKKGYN